MCIENSRVGFYVLPENLNFKPQHTARAPSRPSHVILRGTKANDGAHASMDLKHRKFTVVVITYRVNY